MIQFLFMVSDKDGSAKSVYSRRLITWPVLPRKGERVDVDCLDEVIEIWHHMDDHHPHITVEVEVDPYTLEKLRGDLDYWTENEHDFAKMIW